jgi:hypothetical protein
MLTIETLFEPPVDALAASIHPNDAAELAAALLDVPSALQCVHECKAAFWNGQMIAVFGAQPIVDGGAVPWMLSTTAIDTAGRRDVAYAALLIVRGWMDSYRYLKNMIHQRNDRAIRLVQWLGFTVHDQPIGTGGAFLMFEWRRNV